MHVVSYTSNPQGRTIDFIQNAHQICMHFVAASLGEKSFPIFCAENDMREEI